MIVVDTNVIAYLFITGDFTQQAKKLLKTDHDWIAPILWKSEFRNVLALYMKRGYLTWENSILLLDEAESFMSESEYEVKSSNVMELVSTSNCSAYDCEFVALAQSLNLKMYTSDKKIIKEFPEITISLKGI
jgi:predicted nucleic acid-binding protein